MQDEKYEFLWIGKASALKQAYTTPTASLIPCKDKSCNWDNTENVYIEGDNLEALKLLLETYHERVRVIYIDPPYNTGKKFIYNDNFKSSGLTESHSVWCSMIYPRLIIARQFLCDDGIIFISIDDNEFSNLKKICDEIFGEKCFLATFKWNKVKKAHSLSKVSVRIKYEYILAYFKKSKSRLFGKSSYNKQMPLWHLPNKRQILCFPARSIRVKNDFKSGMYGGTYQVELLNDLICDNGFNRDEVQIAACSAWGQSKILEYVNNGFSFEIKKSPTTMYIDLEQGNNFIPPSDIINSEECNVKCNTDANEEMKKLGIPFDYSKPVSLIKYLIKMVMFHDKDGIILDFFSGSATTAHAVMQLNAEDDGNRKFIMIQLPEQCPKDSEAYKSNFKNICEIGEERIRRAGREIIALRRSSEKSSMHNIDVGFQVFRISE